MFKKPALADFISICSLFLGFWAILLIGSGNPVAACWLIIIAAILDGLDGAIARLFRHSSKFGQQVDSLVDVVSFGVAPSYLLYHEILQSYGIMGRLLAFLPLLMGVIRLARFNVIASESKSARNMFTGLPITCAAITLASYYTYLNHYSGSVGDTRVWASLIVTLSLLMISHIPYSRLPVVQINGVKHPWLSVLILLACAIAVIIDPPSVIFPLMMLYIILGPVTWAATQLRKVRMNSNNDELIDKTAMSARHGISKYLRRKRR